LALHAFEHQSIRPTKVDVVTPLLEIPWSGETFVFRRDITSLIVNDKN
jgi:hypothetical protein